MPRLSAGESEQSVGLDTMQKWIGSLHLPIQKWIENLRIRSYDVWYPLRGSGHVRSTRRREMDYMIEHVVPFTGWCKSQTLTEVQVHTYSLLPLGSSRSLSYRFADSPSATAK